MEAKYWMVEGPTWRRLRGHHPVTRRRGRPGPGARRSRSFRSLLSVAPL